MIVPNPAEEWAKQELASQDAAEAEAAAVDEFKQRLAEQEGRLRQWSDGTSTPVDPQRIELRKTALVHAIDFVRNHRPTQPSADEIVETAATFERYLRDGAASAAVPAEGEG